jgi:phage terminase small subunit
MRQLDERQRAERRAKVKPLSPAARSLRAAIIKEYPSLKDDSAAMSYLAAAMKAYDLAEDAQAEVDADGLTVKDRYGKPRAHPALKILRDARAEYLFFMKAMNLDLEPLQDGPGRPPGHGH